MPEDTTYTRAAQLLVQRFGRHSMSFQLLAPLFMWWHLDDDAGIAYVDTGRAWVAAGPPLCAEQRQGLVAQAFIEAASRENRRAAFFAVSKETFPQAMTRSLLVGQEPLYVPSNWPTLLKSSASLRQQLRRAKSKGLCIRRVRDQDSLEPASPLRRNIAALMAHWSAAHAMPPMQFVVDLDPFVCVNQRLYWVAELQASQNEDPRIVGFAVVIPILASGGYMLEHLLRDTDAPNGCIESLIDAVFTDLARAPVISLGMLPLHHVQNPFLQIARSAGEKLYHFDGLARFKAKLAPARWEDVYIIWPRRQWAYSGLYDVLCAFAPQGLWLFGVGILRRNPRFILRVMAWTLISWTLCLACMKGDVWFPSKILHRFWVIFDVLLNIGLFCLSNKWHQKLATTLAVLVTFDAIATFTQVFLYREPEGLFAEAVRILAVLAPSATAIILWDAKVYHTTLRQKTTHSAT